MYENYIFDVYGTMVDISTDEENILLWNKMSEIYENYGAYYLPNELKEKYDCLVKEEYKKIKLLYPDFKYHDIKIENVFMNLFSSKNINVSSQIAVKVAQTFRDISTEYIKLYDGVIEILTKLKSNNKNLFILSNAQKIFTVPELKKLKIFDFFNDIAISSDFYCAKPDKQFFNFLIEKNSLNKNKTVMIGNDYLSDIAGANSVGISSIYIHQDISPEICGKLLTDKYVMNGNFFELKKYLF